MKKFFGTIFAIIILGIILILNPDGDGVIGVFMVLGGIVALVATYFLVKLAIRLFKGLF